MSPWLRIQIKILAGVTPWPLQDILLLQELCARINDILCKYSLCLGTPSLLYRPHDCAIHYSPPTPLYCNIYHTVLAMAISCKGQVTPPLRNSISHRNPYLLLSRSCEAVQEVMHALTPKSTHSSMFRFGVTSIPFLCFVDAGSPAMNEARLSHLPFGGPSEAVLFSIKRPSGWPEWNVRVLV